MARLREI